MDLEKARLAASRRGKVVVFHYQVTTRHRKLTDSILDHVAEDSGNTESLTDSDGVQQFIFGVTPMNSSVRVGH